MQVLQNVVMQHGIPQCIIIDNGKDFIAKSFTGSKVQVKCHFDTEVEIEIKGIFAELGCDVVRTTPYHGQAKWIERLFGHICGDFSKQSPTYTGSNTVAKPEESKLYHRAINKQAKKEVMITLTEVQNAFASWAHWYNTQWQQNGSGMENQTASRVFATRTSRTDMPVNLLERVFCRAEKRQVRREGIQFANTYYYNPEVVGQFLGRDIIIKRPFNNTSKAFIYSLEGQYLGEALDYQSIGLAETGNTEADIAGKKRLDQQVKKAARAYEEALENKQRSTIFDQHRLPMHQKLGYHEAAKPKRAVGQTHNPSKLPKNLPPSGGPEGSSNNILTLIGDFDDEFNI